jgi:integrase
MTSKARKRTPRKAAPAKRRRQVKPKAVSIMECVERYIAARDGSPEWRRTMRSKMQQFCKWLGEPATIDRMNSEVFNKYVEYLLNSGLARRTAVGYRGIVLAIWRDAYQERLTDEPPTRLRNVKCVHPIVEAFTHDEIRKLLDTAAMFKRRFRDGNLAADFWRAAILTGYCTGLRRGDLLAIKRSQVSPDGTIRLIQSKTGFPIKVRLNADARAAVAKLNGNGDDRLLPYPLGLSEFSTEFRLLREEAGLQRGCFKWLRRAAGSYAESVHAGAGTRLLGHRCESVFHKHYEDTDISQAHVYEPPPIALAEKGGAA